LTDWMPVTDGHALDPIIHRKLEVLSGKVAWTMICSPRFDYASEAAQAEPCRGGILFRGVRGSMGQLHASVPLQISEDGSSAVARFALETGQSATFEWSWGRHATGSDSKSS